jgi:tetratricopeptide (TPR) repeat protein
VSDRPQQARRARALLDQGNYLGAVEAYRALCAETHAVDAEYDAWLRNLARSLTILKRPREAAYIYLYLCDFDRALGQLEAGQDLDAGQMLQHQQRFTEAADRYGAAGRVMLAAIAYERGGDDPRALACWTRARGTRRPGWSIYEEALVCFNLGQCCLRLGDGAAHTHLMTSQHLLEEAADEYETSGQRERAFDCYQILVELGRRTSTFENMAEGYLNCIRILKEDNLKYYVLQYYEDFLREAIARSELHAAASLYREAADYCIRTGLVYANHYLRASAQTWMKVAAKNQAEKGPPEMAENALLAGIDCFNAVSDYPMVGECYRRLSQLGLAERKGQRYAKIAERYSASEGSGLEPPSFPDYLRHPHAYPEIWYQDLVEWELDGEVVPVCAEVIGDRTYPDVVRRRALNVLLDSLELGDAGDPARLARIAEALGGLQIYVVLRPLERFFERHPDPLVQQGTMKALRYLFFKRTFALLGLGLASDEEPVRQAAIEALSRLHFKHAFDPLVRIFRESQDDKVRATALESLGQIPSLEAGDFLVEVLRHEPDPLRLIAKRLLIKFENRDLFDVLLQQLQLETGQMRDDLRDILQLATRRS